jgi:acyl-CoA synthetase (AMP-forming)/AMP-acid ligase II
MAVSPTPSSAEPEEAISAPSYVPFVGEDLVRSRAFVTTLGDLLLSSWDRYADRTALIFPDSQRTYAQLVSNSMRIARGLRAMGVKPREHVGILMPSSPQLVEMLFGIALCGAVSVLINARFRSAELAYVIENGDLVTLLTTDAIAEQVNFVERLNAALPALAGSPDIRHLRLSEAPRLRNVVLFGAPSPGFVTQQYFETAADGIPELDVHRCRVSVCVRDTALILYTSGTTAHPKGCQLSHEAMVRTSTVLGKDRFRLTYLDSVWSPLPLFHIAATCPLIAVMAVGGCYIGMGYFEPGLSLKLLREHRVTLIFAPFVTFLQALAYHPDFKQTDLSSVKLMNSCFAAQPKSVGELYRVAMPGTLQLGTYGMTEASGIVSTGHYGMDPELGYARLGVPLLGVEVRITDPETNNIVPTGQRGEINLRGYSILSGYYRDAQKNAECFDAEGWFHTGDIGSFDESGHIMFHSRLKDMLKVGGENVAAAEIEAQLTTHPAVKLAQVVGIPDPKYTEVPAAFIELHPGQTVTEGELIELCKKHTAAFKVPRLIRFVTEWPMSASKIQKFVLRQRLLEELGLKDS